MSHSGHGHPRRSAPLIQRPSAAAPSSSLATSAGGLSGAVAGALGGMGYAQGQGQSWGYGAPAHGSYGGGGPAAHQLGLHQPYGSGPYGAGQHPAPPQYGAPYSAPHGFQPAPPQAQYSASGSYQQSVYPPSFYPPGSQHHQQPYPYPHHALTPASYGGASQYHPQTTDDGYTLSSTYSGPSSSTSRAGPSSSSSNKRPRAPAPSSSFIPAPAPASASATAPAPPKRNEPTRCSLPECTFTGSKKQVREHEEDRHLIYAPGREPKPWNGSLKPAEGAVIEGTGIALDTPEAVARWIEERKKRWPSKKVVDEKEKARAERVAAGLEAPPRERGGRGRGRGRGQADMRGGFAARGRGRGGYGGSVGRDGEGEPAMKRAKVDESSGSSSDSSDSSEDDSSGSDSDEASEEEDDDDAGPPEEASTKRADPAVAGVEGGVDKTADGYEAGRPVPGDAEGEGPGPQKRFQVVCRHWRRGNCSLGDELCPYLHELRANALPPPPPKRRRPAPPPAPHNPFARPASFADPFSLLEERDYRHLVSDVLQAIEFFGANDWLRGVEIRAGQMDEESGIEVLAEEQVGQASDEGDVMMQEHDGADSAPARVGIEVVNTVAPSAAPSAQPDALDTSNSTTAATPRPSMLATEAPGRSVGEPSQSTPPAAPSTVVSSAVKPAPTPLGGLGGLLADYGSDTDDEAEEESVAAALIGGV
ncbi:uncharacterized protein JCM10292_000161 [Rhodotorula paludigena]|uniref:uncharacterized protein n=1 Tax=Rhodotorula paludigena TaxID=86838 RepID=UPI00317504BD